MRAGISLRVISTTAAFVFLMTGQNKAEKFYKRDNLDVRFDAGIMKILANGKPYTIDASSIPIPDEECGTRCDTLTEPLRAQCHGKCAMGDPEPVAFDAANERLIFGIFTDISQNKPMVLVEADLSGGTYRHLMALYTAGLSDGMLSPSGRYLAYADWTDMGRCFNYSKIGIADLGPLAVTVAEFGAPVPAGRETPTQVSIFTPIRWQSASVLEVQESAFSTASCETPIRESTHTVNIADLHFSLPASPQ